MSNTKNSVISMSAVDVWDTLYLSGPEAFERYKEGVRGTFLPWRTELRSECDFRARLESVRFENGFVGRIRSTPARAIRTKAEIANSHLECLYASLRLSGDAAIQQGENVLVANPGDIIIFDSCKPTIFTSLGDSEGDAVALMIPMTDSLRGFTLKGPRLLERDRVLDPFSRCFGFLTRNLFAFSRTELQSLFDSCVGLLPLAVGFDAALMLESKLAGSGSLTRDILNFIDENLADSQVSARRVGANFNISERYVHKLLARCDITFSHYLTRRRLEHVRADLVNPAFRRTPISLVAYRWGFTDLSTFNKAFRGLFGCSPRQFRA
jgi:AraC family transcriptional regulator, positive regulator of tynA and feaB